ncbi:MAG: hypothetical protein IGS23_11715 [Rivularia sp. T60_A2020_040]|nr:hypothetical protein [Rivularia sp. T60_A2020_040]
MKSKFVTLVGTVLTLALSSTVAVAQSNKFPERDFPSSETTTETSEPSADGSNMVAAAEEKLSPDAMEILCVRFPLNSRCEGKAEATTSPENTNTEEITPPDNTIETTPGAPLPGTTPEGEVAPSEDDAPTNMTPMPGGMTPEAIPSEDDAPTNMTPMPGGMTPEAIPSEDDAPTNMTPMPGGMTPEAIPSEDDAPANITPMPGGMTPEAIPSQDDGPTNITPMPGGVTPEAIPSQDDAPTNLNQPGDTTLPDSNSPSNTEEETTPDNGAGILAPQ